VIGRYQILEAGVKEHLLLLTVVSSHGVSTGEKTHKTFPRCLVLAFFSDLLAHSFCAWPRLQEYWQGITPIASCHSPLIICGFRSGRRFPIHDPGFFNACQNPNIRAPLDRDGEAA
jgi:hypothetical protein